MRRVLLQRNHETSNFVFCRKQLLHRVVSFHATTDSVNTMDGSPFYDQKRVVDWNLSLEFDTGRVVYKHRLMVGPAFRFFEGLLETDVQERKSFRMPPAAEQPVASDLMCLMLSLLYHDWQMAGITEDRAKVKCRYWDIKKAADFLGATSGALKALTAPCRCCEGPTTRYARDMAVPGSSGMCPDCWQLDVKRESWADKGGLKQCTDYNFEAYNLQHYTDTNVIWDTREDIIEKILSAGEDTIAPTRLIHALAKQIQASCPISGCMDFQSLLASFMTDGLRLATEHLQQLLDAVGLEVTHAAACMLLYSVMLCPWECPEDAPHGDAFLQMSCNVPWCTKWHCNTLSVHSLKRRVYMSSNASTSCPYIDCSCGQCPGDHGQN